MRTLELPGSGSDLTGSRPVGVLVGLTHPSPSQKPANDDPVDLRTGMNLTSYWEKTVIIPVQEDLCVITMSLLPVVKCL